MKKILTFGRYLKKKFHKRIKKIPISLSGFTCPNIDGKVAKGGCTYCDNSSFSPNYTKNKKLNFQEEDILNLQLEELKTQYNQTSNFYRSLGYEKFIVYFQSFSNTYAPFDRLYALYNNALLLKDVIGLSIGTRTDCVEIEVLNLLKNLSKKNEIWLEYGVQSTNDETLKSINRGHNVANLKEMIIATKDLDIKVCGHLIFGLPSDSKKDMLKSLEDILNLGVDSIKFHPLYIVKKTIMSNLFFDKLITPISRDEYFDVLLDALKIIDKNIIVQRLLAGTNDDSLLGDLFFRDKNLATKELRVFLKQNGIII